MPPPLTSLNGSLPKLGGIQTSTPANYPGANPISQLGGILKNFLAPNPYPNLPQNMGGNIPNKNGSLVNTTGTGGALQAPETGGQSLNAIPIYKPNPAPAGQSPDPLPTGTNTGNGQLPASGMFGSYMSNPANAQSQNTQAKVLATPQYGSTFYDPKTGQAAGTNMFDPNTGKPLAQPQNNQSSNPLSGYINSDANQQYLQQQTDTLTKLGALQQQLAGLGVQSPEEVQLQQMINQTQNTLNNTNPQQYLKDNPALQQGGITEGQLERTTQQAEVPLSQSLANYVLAKSALTQTRTNEQQAVGAEATGLGAQADIQNQIRQLNMFGGLPPDIASAILQKQLFPPYQTYTNLAGMPGVVSEGPGGTFQSQLLGSGVGGIGSPQGGGIPGSPQAGQTQSQGGQYGNFSQVIAQQVPAIDITGTGLPVAMNYMANGQPYIAQDKIDSRLTGLVQSVAPANGIPVLNTEQVAKVQSIDVTKQNLEQLGQTINGTNGQGGILSSGLFGRTVGAASNTLADFFQTNPEISAFKTYRDTAINTIQALAGGSGSGFRLNQGEINTAVSNLPSLTDNLETANKKLSLLNGFLDKWSSELVGKNMPQQGTSQSGGESLYNF